MTHKLQIRPAKWCRDGRWTMRGKIIHNQVVKQRMDPGDIGYVGLTEFTEQADAGLRRAIRSLRSQAG